MFVLHLLFHLMLKKKKPGRTLPEIHRHIDKEPVVVECPFCHHVTISRHIAIEESPGPGPRDWKPVNEVFQCEQCQQVLDADSFENDGSGVLRAKKWICASCQAENHALQFTCSQCHQWHS